jgi:phosphonate transport system substrate-binding protein
MSPQADRSSFRFLLPSSLGAEAQSMASLLEGELRRGLGLPCEVAVAQDYKSLSADLLAWRADAGWAPPYVCAQLEAMGARIVGRVLRRGGATYRAALVCRAKDPLGLMDLAGKRAAWVDGESIGGRLLALAFLKSMGVEPHKTFGAQEILGSYQKAVEAVLDGRADVASVYAPAGPPDEGPTGLPEVVPGREAELRIMAYTEAVPNDGVAVAMALGMEVQERLLNVLSDLGGSPQGKRLLEGLFHGEGFEPAPRLGYRALYRVAQASL